MKRALVVSGGGALGAWGGGLVEGLSKNKTYDLGVGTSTGSLIVPLAITKQFDKLKQGYTSVTQTDIFDFNPINKKGNINVIKAIWRLITKKKTLGDSNNLKKIIDKFLTEEDYYQIITHNKEVAVCCANLNEYDVGYFSSNKESYSDFKEWMWISANAPVYMSLINKNGDYWVDGGIGDHTPIQYAIDNGADEIDIVVHKTKDIEDNKTIWKPKGIFSVFFRVIDYLLYNVYKDDINFGKLQAKNKDIKLNIYYMPFNFLPHFLLFDKDKMNRMWEIGLSDAEEPPPKKIVLKV